MRAPKVAGLALVGASFLCGCSRKAPPSPAETAPRSELTADVVARARAEFETLPGSAAAGTSKRYSRSDFLPPGDRRAMLEGDFIGRLRALFGPAPDDEYALRHRQSGLVVTAYSAQSGPSYGGAGAEMDAGPVFAGAVARLDQLVSAVKPVDWEAIRYFEDAPSVLRVGARAGVGFEEELAPPEGLRYLLGQADAPAGDGFTENEHVVDYYVAHSAEDGSLAAQLPRVQAAWFRSVAIAHQQDRKELRDLLLKDAAGVAKTLGIDPEKASAALRAHALD